MVNKRNCRKQMWADLEFVETLERIKAQKQLIGKPAKSLPDLTKEILSCESFREVVKELLEGQTDIRMRFDKKRIW